jgi:hypothetical protein
MKKILNTLTKMHNAIGLTALCGAIATTAMFASSAAAAPVKGMDKTYVCVGLSGKVITAISPRMTDELVRLLKSPQANVRIKGV